MGDGILDGVKILAKEAEIERCVIVSTAGGDGKFVGECAIGLSGHEPDHVGLDMGREDLLPLLYRDTPVKCRLRRPEQGAVTATGEGKQDRFDRRRGDGEILS